MPVPAGAFFQRHRRVPGWLAGDGQARAGEDGAAQRASEIRAVRFQQIRLEPEAQRTVRCGGLFDRDSQRALARDHSRDLRRNFFAGQTRRMFRQFRPDDTVVEAADEVADGSRL